MTAVPAPEDGQVAVAPPGAAAVPVVAPNLVAVPANPVPVPIDLIGAAACCHCDTRPGLKRHHVAEFGGGALVMASIGAFCLRCGYVRETGTRLHAGDLAEAADVYGRVANGSRAVTARAATGAVAEGMPTAFDLEDLGLVTRLPAAARFEGFPTARADLQPRLRSMLGMTGAPLERRFEARNFPDGVRATDALTVDHIFQPDGMRANRVDENHVAYWPLMALTLQNPFEIWSQTPPDKAAGWAFFAAYRIAGVYDYHMVYVTRRRIVLTAYRLSGVPQLQTKRLGIPIYVAYR